MSSRFSVLTPEKLSWRSAEYNRAFTRFATQKSPMGH
jgi:hypothetical protein